MQYQSITLLIGLAVAAAMLPPPCTAADVPASEPARVQAAIQAAAQRPPDPQQVLAAASTRLLDNIDRVERFLAGGGPETSRGWSEWLRLPEIKAELADPQPSLPVLREITQRMDAGQAGLEMPPLVALRRALAGFVAAQEYASAKSPAGEYRRRLQELSQSVARLEVDPQSADAQLAGETAAWLEFQSPAGAAAARAVRARYCRQNVAAQVSGRLINALLAQQVDERQFLTDIILGTYTHGPAFTSGRVSFATVPNRDQAVLEVHLQGLTLCPANVAQKRQVTLYSTASTSISATKRVHLNDQGLDLTPTVARCSTSAQIQDVAASSRLVERLAWRRAHKLLPEAEAAAARKAEAHSSAKLDERADAALGGINDLYLRQIRAPLIRQDALPLLKFWTDRQHLRLALSQHNDRQLAPAGPVPQFPGGYDLGLAAHESMIENFCESMLGGATVKDKAFLDMMNLLTGSQPRAPWVHDRAVRWSVTFADERPIAAQFQDDRLGLTLRLAGVRRNSDELAVPVEIAVRLIPEACARRTGSDSRRRSVDPLSGAAIGRRRCVLRHVPRAQISRPSSRPNCTSTASSRPPVARSAGCATSRSSNSRAAMAGRRLAISFRATESDGESARREGALRLWRKTILDHGWTLPAKDSRPRWVTGKLGVGFSTLHSPPPTAQEVPEATKEEIATLGKGTNSLDNHFRPLSLQRYQVRLDPRAASLDRKQPLAAIVAQRQVARGIAGDEFRGQLVERTVAVGRVQKLGHHENIEPRDRFVIAAAVGVGRAMRIVEPANAIAQAEQSVIGSEAIDVPQPDSQMGLVRPIGLGERATGKGSDQLVGGNGEHTK